MEMAKKPILTLLLCPTSIAIHDDGYMARKTGFINLA
jgi:hypothetical protein